MLIRFCSRVQTRNSILRITEEVKLASPEYVSDKHVLWGDPLYPRVAYTSFLLSGPELSLLLLAPDCKGLLSASPGKRIVYAISCVRGKRAYNSFKLYRSCAPFPHAAYYIALICHYFIRTHPPSVVYNPL